MEDLRGFAADRPRLLITGVDGALGANLAMRLAANFVITGVCQNTPISLPACRIWPLQGSDRLASLVRELAPKWIIHCGAASRGSWDAVEDEVDAELELRLCHTLREAASAVGSSLTVISTDAVFAGRRGFRREGHSTDGVSALAQVARLVEQALCGTNALVVRSCIYGWSPTGGRPGFAERAWQAFSEGNRFTADPDLFATPILATDLADLLLRSYRRGLTGLYHFAGAERVSAYCFARELASIFELPGELTSMDRSIAEVLHLPRVQDSSLDTRCARRRLACTMPLVREGLERFADQVHNGHRARLRAPGAWTLHASEAA